ncbi:putative defense protein Hdd11-like [Hermetia illucens]|uniref:putative defense protein Hdd11-like n=1 Tax=Hermetia illucens TaxID=343691 RepID=UPI0018CBF344|nr:putative defense protein Hdd11-like [Hermetia illucens]
MSSFYYVTFLALLTTPAVWSYSSGAPPTACDILGPKHPDPNNKAQLITSQRGPAPFKLAAPASAEASKPLQIKLLATGAEEIQGFIVQAQLGDKAVGNFAPVDSNAKVLQCASDSDTITHTKIKDSHVKEVTFNWIPSADLKGKSVKLVGTVAAGYDKFWIKGVTADVQVN